MPISFNNKSENIQKKTIITTKTAQTIYKTRQKKENKLL